MEITNNTGFERKGDIHRRQIDVDGTPVARFTESTNEFGMYAIGNKLYDNGSVVAMSGQEHPFYTNEDGVPKFGEVELVTEGKVINITLENYNKLLNRELVPGYKYLDLWDVYYITDTPSKLRDVSYTRDHSDPNNKTVTFVEGNETYTVPERPHMLYNNVIGDAGQFDVENDEYKEVYCEEDMEKTVKRMNAPYLVVRYFNPRIKPWEPGGNTIKVQFCVDDFFASYMQGRTIGGYNGVHKQEVTGPYTIELRIEDSNDSNKVVRKTVYAGEGVIETPEFANIPGETWFTLRCIDANGVGSAVHYFDVLIEDEDYNENLWEVADNNDATDDNDLAYYDIYPDVADNDPEGLIKAYKNKGGLSSLFAAAVTKGYNGILLPKHNYKICDYKNISEEEGVVDLGNDRVSYFYCTLQGFYRKEITVVKELTASQVESEQLETSVAYKKSNDTPPQLSTMVVADFVVGTPGVLDSEGTEYDVGTYCFVVTENGITKYFSCKIEVVRFNNKITSIQPRTEDEVMVDGDNIYQDINDMVAYHPHKKVGKSYVRMIESEVKVNAETLYNSSGKIIPEGRRYLLVYDNKALSGDYIQFPSNFVVDLNGASIEIVKQYDLKASHCITINNATNLHIRNGMIKGGLHTYEFRRACLRHNTPNPMEQIAPLYRAGNRFCSFTDITFYGTMGYLAPSDPDVNCGAIDRYNAFTPKNYTGSNGPTGVYDGKRIDLVLDPEHPERYGKIADAYELSNDEVPDNYTANQYQTVVIADTSKQYVDETPDSDDLEDPENSLYAGYINLADATTKPGCNYIYVGYGVNFVTNRGLRREIFIVFYDSSNAVVKVVKSRPTWMVRIPNGAVKVRFMGFGHSTAKKVDSEDPSSWNFIGVSQVRNAVGTVYKDLFIHEVRSAWRFGGERQMLCENVRFKDTCYNNLVNPGNVGTWSAFTWACIDLESGFPMAKYIRINNITYESTHTYGNNTWGIIVQGAESIEITNCTCNLTEQGLWSGFIENNTIYDDTSYALHIVRRFNSSVFHRHVLWDNNTVSCNKANEEPIYNVFSFYPTPDQVEEWKKDKCKPVYYADSDPESSDPEYREDKILLQRTTVNKGYMRQYEANRLRLIFRHSQYYVAPSNKNDAYEDWIKTYVD